MFCPLFGILRRRKPGCSAEPAACDAPGQGPNNTMNVGATSLDVFLERGAAGPRDATPAGKDTLQ